MAEGDRNAFGTSRRGLSRRALFTGVGTSAALLTAGAIAPAAADAADERRVARDAERAAVHPDGAPITTAFGSAAVSGRAYITANMYEFLPFNPTTQKTWGGSGIYGAGTATTLRANLGIPSGALIRDVEWYALNKGTSDVIANLWQYAPGFGTISTIAATTIPANGTSIVAVRSVVPATSQGPYPLGSALLAGMATPTDGTVQINGVRIGYTHGGGSVGLLPSSVRVFDSRSGKKLAAGSTRTITLPSAVFAPGVIGVLANVTAIDGTSGGHLKIWAGNASAPATNAIDFGTADIANAVTVPVSGTGILKVSVSKPAHVVVDVIGTIS